MLKNFEVENNIEERWKEEIQECFLLDYCEVSRKIFEPK